MVINNTKTYNKKRFWAGILLAQFVLFYTFSHFRFFIDLFENFYDVQKNVHITIFAWVPFSFGDILYILLSLFLLKIVYSIFRKNLRKRALLNLMILFNISYFIYQIFWGMMYFQTPIIKKLKSQEQPTVVKAKILAIKYLNKAKETRKHVTEDRNGVFIIKERNVLIDEILAQQKLLPKNISSKTPLLKKSVKESIFSQVMSYTGISGYYNPFTAESQFNHNLPHSILPFTIAHETSHQLGFAREQEASFIAYVIGVNSQNSDLKYSTEYTTLKSLLRYIYSEDEAFAEQIIKQYSPAMKRDRAYERNFMIHHESTLEDFFGFTNDLFLKSNRQDGAVTYSYFIDLLLNYEK